MRLGGEDERTNLNENHDDRNCNGKRMFVYILIGILMFFMLKNALSNNRTNYYEQSTKDYYVSIGREDKGTYLKRHHTIHINNE